ncbi:MAG: multidrug effflux MFS transporter [Geminicoccaceae bacterium]|nr:multidrug effflux MFS transporter [Geminicoccaceae bacterium]
MPEPTRHLRPGSAGFVALIAGIITMTAASIDMNLPAIPATAVDLGVEPEVAQLTVSFFFLGFALAQAVAGPLSDRFGRRPVLLWGMAGYLVATVGCLMAPSIEALLVMRALQGLFAASGPVLGRAVVRDLFEGPEMARIMSFTMAAFILAPMIAPSVGALLLGLGSWRWIFGFLLVYVALLLALTWRLFDESLARPDPAALRPSRIAQGWRIVLTSRPSLVYGAVTCFTMAMLLIYLATAAPLFMVTMGLSAGGFGVLFALVAACAAIGSLGNARLVRRFSLEAIVRFALLLTLAAILGGLAVQVLGLASPVTLGFVFGAFFLSFSLTVSNATTLALAPHGGMVGAASSVIGVVQSLAAAAISAAVGLAFDGTALPALLAMLVLVVLSLGALRLGGRARAAATA